MQFVNDRKVWLLSILLVAILPLLVKSNLQLALFTQMGIAIVFALSYNMLLGQCGLLSFGHAIFFGLGAYFTIHTLRFANENIFAIPLPFQPIIGALASGVLGAVLGTFATKKAGATFAMITMGINEVMVTVALMFTNFFGSETGIEATREPWLGLKFGSQTQVYYLVFFWVFISVMLMYAFGKTPLGRIANAVRDNPERTSFVSYNPVLVRGLVLTISGFFAGLAGGLYAINWEIVSYENLSIMQSAFVLFMVFIGGTGYFFGPVIGAILVTYLVFYLSAFTEAWLLYLGILFMLTVLFAPSGIAGIIMKHKEIGGGRHVIKLLPSYLRALAPSLLMALSGVVFVETVYHFWSGSNYAQDSMSLFGIQLHCSAWWLLAFSVLGMVAGGFFLKNALVKVRSCWNEVISEVKGAAV